MISMRGKGRRLDSASLAVQVVHVLLLNKTCPQDFFLEFGRRSEQNLGAGDVLSRNVFLFFRTVRLEAHSEDSELFEVHAVAVHQVPRKDFEQVVDY